MATETPAKRFVEEIVREIIEPGVARLLESRYFTDLRAGRLTKRRMQGFAIQHYRHNMGILKGFALLAVQSAAHNDLFRVYAGGIGEELTHPDMCKTFRLRPRPDRRRLREGPPHVRLPGPHRRLPA